jgi:ribosome modulation factor
MLRAHGERRQKRDRLELADGRGMFAIAGGKAIAQEEHVELRALGGGRDVLHQAEVRPARRDSIGMPPAGDVMPGRLDEDAEPHLLLVSHVLSGQAVEEAWRALRASYIRGRSRFIFRL